MISGRQALEEKRFMMNFLGCDDSGRQVLEEKIFVMNFLGCDDFWEAGT